MEPMFRDFGERESLGVGIISVSADRLTAECYPNPETSGES